MAKVTGKTDNPKVEKYLLEQMQKYENESDEVKAAIKKYILQFGFNPTDKEVFIFRLIFE